MMMMMMMMMDDVDKIGTPKPSECLGNAQAMYASHTGMMHERVSGKENMVQQMRSTWGKKKKKKSQNRKTKRRANDTD